MFKKKFINPKLKKLIFEDSDNNFINNPNNLFIINHKVFLLKNLIGKNLINYNNSLNVGKLSNLEIYNSTIRILLDSTNITNNTALRIGSNNNNSTILRVDDSIGITNNSQNGFTIKYKGSNSGNNKSLSFISDNNFVKNNIITYGGPNGFLITSSIEKNGTITATNTDLNGFQLRTNWCRNSSFRISKPDKLFDNDLSDTTGTYEAVSGNTIPPLTGDAYSTNHYIWITIKLLNSTKITNVRLWGRNTDPPLFPRELYFQGGFDWGSSIATTDDEYIQPSLDDTKWTNLFSWSGNQQASPGNSTPTLSNTIINETITDTTYYSHVRLKITKPTTDSPYTGTPNFLIGELQIVGEQENSLGISQIDTIEILQNGNIGIGETNPETKLHINYKGLTNDKGLIIENDSSTTSASGNDNDACIKIKSKQNGESSIVFSHNNERKFKFTAGDAIGEALYVQNYNGSNTVPFVLDQNSNIGIGVTYPSTKLHVLSDTYIENLPICVIKTNNTYTAGTNSYQIYPLTYRAPIPLFTSANRTEVIKQNMRTEYFYTSNGEGVKIIANVSGMYCISINYFGISADSNDWFAVGYQEGLTGRYTSGSFNNNYTSSSLTLDGRRTGQYFMRTSNTTLANRTVANGLHIFYLNANEYIVPYVQSMESFRLINSSIPLTVSVFMLKG